MNPELKKLMLPFYFGSVSENERLFVEREMLSDAEVLIDYLDLKRQVEAANKLESKPSASLWEKIKPKTVAQTKIWITLSIGAALAASLIFLFIFQPTTKTQEMLLPSVDRALIDTSSELSVSSSVL